MTPTEQYNKELYHYGVKGMKWGVRKSRAEIEAARLARYKKSEISAIERRRRRESKWEDRAVNRRTKKYNAAVEKHGAGSTKAKRAEERLVKAKTNAIVGRKIAEAEIKRVGKMTLSEVKNENRHIGEKQVQNMILYKHAYDQRNSGTNSTTRMPYVNPMAQYRYNFNTRSNLSTARYLNDDITSYKTNTRLGGQQISDIRKKAEREARKSIGR